MKEMYTYESFPEDNSSCPGMQIIHGYDRIGIKCYPDVVYARKDGIDLHLRIVAPMRIDESIQYPVLVHIQGSAWMQQNLNANIGNLMPIVSSGYILVIVEYRYAPQYRFPCQVEDGKSAIRFLMSKAEEYHIDTKNVFLSGDSSGGHTAMCMMATWDTEECDYERTKLPKLRGCIDLYGSLNCLTMNDGISAYDHDDLDSPASIFLGFSAKTNPQKAFKATPFYYIHPWTKLPPILIMHGSKDRTVPFIQSFNFYKFLSSQNRTCEFYKVEKADHGGVVFYCDETLETIIKFLNNNKK
ncbi:MULTISPECIES: alpha/beta hydrolase [Faecalicoccus]|uniref:Alpha/beta hydrolase n=1 Tax=Faecalicoccus pleomorphus TaxID=1323 RepID=A0AAW6CS78_9FIRM|nr:MULTISPECIES: alpha/beta hydrolase [Faecalicoccus]MDB7980146.1 alpha/beta hydrolase [Faecalicoccus pleomorphus]MDB7982448.1 alpha/beta hydrolase [Faecalicoccus pleomorphus]MDB7987717.1 alpha/beta hydrolase [Faecalicoccus pleomorphus]MDB7992238.1 alpha/beta hydrolase [Faecalicoccus pleomorphus]MDY4278748.1 alpha/beta hydrolase [Faecalicoccus sp.]